MLRYDEMTLSDPDASARLSAKALFTTVMLVMMWDAVSLLSPSAKSAHYRHELTDLVYADDTLSMFVACNFCNSFSLLSLKLDTSTV